MSSTNNRWKRKNGTWIRKKARLAKNKQKAQAKKSAKVKAFHLSQKSNDK